MLDSLRRHLAPTPHGDQEKPAILEADFLQDDIYTKVSVRHFGNSSCLSKTMHFKTHLIAKDQKMSQLRFWKGASSSSIPRDLLSNTSSFLIGCSETSETSFPHLRTHRDALEDAWTSQIQKCNCVVSHRLFMYPNVWGCSHLCVCVLTFRCRIQVQCCHDFLHYTTWLCLGIRGGNSGQSRTVRTHNFNASADKTVFLRRTALRQCKTMCIFFIVASQSSRFDAMSWPTRKIGLHENEIQNQRGLFCPAAGSDSQTIEKESLPQQQASHGLTLS